jgi:hypothetical protein
MAGSPPALSVVFDAAKEAAAAASKAALAEARALEPEKASANNAQLQRDISRLRTQVASTLCEGHPIFPLIFFLIFCAGVVSYLL